MVAAVLYFQATYLASWLGGYRSWQMVAEFAMVVVIAVVGIHECFRANGGAQGNEFLLRFSALSVPVGIRVTVGAHVFGQLVYFGFGHGVATAFANPGLAYQAIGFMSALAITFIYYWRIAVHLANVARQGSNPSIERTGSGGLRPPEPAAHVKR